MQAHSAKSDILHSIPMHIHDSALPLHVGNVDAISGLETD